MNGFTVCQIDTASSPAPAYSRRDFYTIYLLTGPHQLQSADQAIAFDGTCLCVGNSPEKEAEAGGAARQTGYACRFTEAFFRRHRSAVSPAQWSLFSGHPGHAFALSEEQATYLTDLFEKMLAEQQSPYLFRHELLRTYLQLVIHEALRLRTPAPKRFFRYYRRQPVGSSELVVGKGRRHCSRR